MDTLSYSTGLYHTHSLVFYFWLFVLVIGWLVGWLVWVPVGGDTVNILAAGN